MSSLTIENRLLIKVLASVIRSHGRHNEHRFSYFWKAGLAGTLLTPHICLKDISGNFVFIYFTFQLQNKEYLKPYSGTGLCPAKNFFLHISLKLHDSVMYGCKTVVHKLCAIFLEHPVYH